MKALSLWQPWASLIAHGEKKIETRHWQTAYRGPLIIHAAKTRQGLMYAPPLAAQVLAENANLSIDKLPYGGYLAIADLVDIIPSELFLKLDAAHRRPCIQITGGGFVRAASHEREFGDYSPGRFGWILDNVRPLSGLVPARGRQSLWTPPVEEHERVASLVQQPLFDLAEVQ